ncbi:hypothetical protein N4T77_14380 [Clostridium sp. CX1]|uniref:Spore coat protein n=1 Tax=Clostridium tanneri TaxID=3037988 RepID=A0ABU4JRT6_9CLOT|nr:MULTISPECIES: hypothetical protein [unclassified Clostridium]MCT8977784.1 hypothetical protein [Clostridium sp. CX1]MDW8800861.1 hypothetical protein [Clostridium sp. A1-XYC3]
MADNNSCNNNNQQNNNEQNNNQKNNNQQNKSNGLAPHEMLELHELMNAGIIGAKKTQASLSMVQDEELKSFMQDSLNSKKSSLEQMQQFISNQANLQQ